MNNYQFPYGTNPTQSPFGQFQQIQQMFPQPQGSVYSINSPIEIGNVPIGSTGLSVALCLNENVMYIKSFQNGNPIIMTYRVTPFSKKDDPDDNKTPSAAVNVEPNADLLSRISNLETKLNQLTTPTGGKFDGLL